MEWETDHYFSLVTSGTTHFSSRWEWVDRTHPIVQHCEVQCLAPAIRNQSQMLKENKEESDQLFKFTAIAPSWIPTKVYAQVTENQGINFLLLAIGRSRNFLLWNHLCGRAGRSLKLTWLYGHVDYCLCYDMYLFKILFYLFPVFFAPIIEAWAGR